MKGKGRAVPDVRVHFVHVRSENRDAVPLLLIPSFPFTNLSLKDGLVKGLGEEFHVVVPSVPGLGFSDAFVSEGNVLEWTAGIFDKLMARLGYESYIVSAMGSGKDSAAGIDYWIPRLMGERFEDRCLGVHLLDPIVEAPTFVGEPWMWVKWRVAKFFHAAWWGYEEADWKALGELERRRKIERREGEEAPLLPRREVTGYGAVGMVGLRELNTFAYALCDSPVGLLSLVCSALKRKGPKHELSKTEIIDVTQLAWLPGPEAGFRFWTAAVKGVELLKKEKSVRSRVAVTVFGADGSDSDGYTCPAWASRHHNVVFAQRATGRAGLLAWERAEVLIAGIRGLARAIEAVDGRLKARPLEEVVVLGEEAIPEETGDNSETHSIQLDVESPIQWSRRS
jgi:pimeloyl-ACP methyl ester carboxylesterase